jgi:hypothetical protein
VVVTLGISLLLALLETGFGASAVNPLQEQNPFHGLGLLAIVWTIISVIVAFFVGGWMAAYGSGWVTTRREALSHATVAWAVTSLLSVWLVTGAAGSLLAGGAGLIGQTISGSTRAATQSPEISARVREELEKRGIDVSSLREQAQSPEAQAKAEALARQAGETVAKGVTAAAFGAFGLLLLGLIASLVGALTAVRQSGREVTVASERVA